MIDSREVVPCPQSTRHYLTVEAFASAAYHLSLDSANRSSTLGMVTLQPARRSKRSRVQRQRNVVAVNYRIESVSFRLARHPGSPDPRVVGTPKAVVSLVQELDLLPDDAREHCGMFMLDAKLQVIAWHYVSMGTLTSTLVSPREVFGAALRVAGVAGVVLVHNHPSGDPTPSREDVNLTCGLVEAGKLVEVEVHDHLIIGDGTGRWVSLSDQGMMA